MYYRVLKQFKIIAQGFTILKREFIFSKGGKIFRFFCSTNENVKMRCSIFEQSWNGKPWQRKLQNLLVLMIRIYRQIFSRAELSDELSFWPIWRKSTLNRYNQTKVKLAEKNMKKQPKHVKGAKINLKLTKQRRGQN